MKPPLLESLWVSVFTSVYAVELPRLSKGGYGMPSSPDARTQAMDAAKREAAAACALFSETHPAPVGNSGTSDHHLDLVAIGAGLEGVRVALLMIAEVLQGIAETSR